MLPSCLCIEKQRVHTKDRNNAISWPSYQRGLHQNKVRGKPESNQHNRQKSLSFKLTLVHKLIQKDLKVKHLNPVWAVMACGTKPLPTVMYSHFLTTIANIYLHMSICANDTLAISCRHKHFKKRTFFYLMLELHVRCAGRGANGVFSKPNSVPTIKKTIKKISCQPGHSLTRALRPIKKIKKSHIAN